MSAVAQYLQHLAAERRLSPHTVAAYQRDLDNLTRLTAGKPLADLDTTDIRGAIVKLRSQNLSATSVARQLSSWRGFYTFACRRLGYPRNPCLGLRPPKAAKALPDILSPDTCTQLLDGAAASTADDPLLARDRAMFELFYSSGLRLSELAGLDLDDVNLQSGEAQVTGKGRKTRIVPVGKAALDAIAAWLAHRQPLAHDNTAALFIGQHGSRLGPRSVQLRLDRWARQAGLGQHVHPHMLRHAFATHVLQSSGDLRAVQEMLGHASISTTQVYTHLDWQHLAKVYDQAHPRARKKGLSLAETGREQSQSRNTGSSHPSGKAHAVDSLRMRAHPASIFARLIQALRPAQFGTQARVMGALLLILLAVLALAGQQALQIARQDADSALRVQAAAQLAALSQTVADSAILRDYNALQSQLKTPIAQGNLQYVEYTTPHGYVLREEAPAHHAGRPDWFAALTGLTIPVMREAIVIGDAYYGRLVIQPSAHVYEDFLWHLGTRLFLLLAVAFALLGWLTHVLLRINLQDLTRLRATARQIETGDYSLRLPIRASSPPELQETTRAFNHMSAALERLLTDLGEQQKALDSTASVTESDLAGNITFANDLFCTLSGYTRDELIGQNHRIINSGQHDPAYFSELWASISSGRTWRGEICNRAKDGQLFWTATTIIPIKDDNGLPMKYLSIRFDITQRKLDEAALSEEKERWQVTVQSINDAVIVTNMRNEVVYLNPTAEALLDIAQQEALSIPLQNLIQLDQLGDDDAPACFLAPTAHGKTGSASLKTRQGQHLAISYSCAPLTGNDGGGAIYVLRDETEKKQLLDSLRDMAFHDALTGLPNRRAVEGRLGRAMRTALDQVQQHAFCYIDLDQFKLVNDTCGHSVGDALLMDIAQTMKDALPDHAYLGRLGGDEFGLILFDSLPAEAIQVCRQLVQRIRDLRFEHKGRRFTLGACAGVASITQTAATAGDIMVQADMACYRAKSEGSGRVMLYEADEVGFRRLEAEMGWAADFAQALEANQFLPYRQLIQPTSRGGQPHYEVLVRWQRNGEIEGPAKLLPALERYGQAPILDRWMVEAVVSYLAAQPDDTAVYFINLSGKTVADESFLGTVCHLLDHYGVAGERLGFEVTETAAVVNLEDAQRLIHGLRERGCQFALDDFGRDASSFFYLKHLPADFLKIDGAFVRGMLDDRRDQAIVRSIAKLASDFGMYSVAEQVENTEMAALLRDMGVDYLQGYHIHRPEAFPFWQPVTRMPAEIRPMRIPHLSLVS